MRRSIFKLFPCLLAVVTGCAATPPKQVPKTPAELDDRDYAVFSAIIDARFPKTWHDLVGVGERTEDAWSLAIYHVPTEEALTADLHAVPGAVIKYMKQRFPTLDPDLISDIFEKPGCPMSARFSCAVPVEIKPLKEMKGLFEHNRKEFEGWPENKKPLPRLYGVLLFSKVGFTQDGRKALVYVADLTHEGGSKGDFLELAFQNGNWVVTNTENWWKE
jgi:hypothetical protein